MKFFKTIERKIQQASSDKGFLDLSEHQLNDQDIEELIPLIKKANAVFSLKLSHNNIGSQGAINLAGLSLSSLDLSYNNVDDDAILALAQSKIKEIDLSCNNILDHGAQILAEQSQQEILMLARTKVSNELIAKIAERLAQNVRKQNRNSKS